MGHISVWKENFLQNFFKRLFVKPARFLPERIKLRLEIACAGEEGSFSLLTGGVKKRGMPEKIGGLLRYKREYQWSKMEFCSGNEDCGVESFFRRFRLGGTEWICIVPTIAQMVHIYDD